MSMTDTTCSISNTEMHRRLDQLAQLGNCNSLLGYAIVRNIRHLSEACKEYLQAYQQALSKYDITNMEGANAEQFATELEEYAFIEHTVVISQVSMLDACKQLTAEQMLNLSWMLKDSLEESCKD